MDIRPAHKVQEELKKIAEEYRKVLEMQSCLEGLELQTEWGKKEKEERLVVVRALAESFAERSPDLEDELAFANIASMSEFSESLRAEDVVYEGVVGASVNET